MIINFFSRNKESRKSCVINVYTISYTCQINYESAFLKLQSHDLVNNFYFNNNRDLNRSISVKTCNGKNNFEVLSTSKSLILPINNIVYVDRNSKTKEHVDVSRSD